MHGERGPELHQLFRTCERGIQLDIALTVYAGIVHLAIEIGLQNLGLVNFKRVDAGRRSISGKIVGHIFHRQGVNVVDLARVVAVCAAVHLQCPELRIVGANGKRSAGLYLGNGVAQVVVAGQQGCGCNADKVGGIDNRAGLFLARRRFVDLRQNGGNVGKGHTGRHGITPFQ